MIGLGSNHGRISSGTPLRLVVNPAAGVGRARRALPSVRAALAAGGWDVDVVMVGSLGAATELSAELPRGHAVAALGGDGLVARPRPALDGQVPSSPRCRADAATTTAALSG